MKMIKFVFSNDLSDFRSTFVIIEEAVKISPFFDLPPPLLQSSEGSKNEERA
jgi:hypothetical protein